MDAFRGFVQKLGVGGVGGGDGGHARPSGSGSTTESLDGHLPLTKSFLAETLPRAPILAAAKSNARKAAEAHALIRQVDEHITAHASAAAELKEYISQLSSMRADIDAAAKQAKSMQTQLLELEGMLSAAGNGELLELQAAEDARFEAVAREKRKKIAEIQRGYSEQLEAFQKERVKLLVAQGGGTSGKGKRRPLPVGKGLEEVAITADETALELDDFFGGGNEGLAGQEVGFVKSTSASRRAVEGKQKDTKSAPPSSPAAPAPAKKKKSHAVLADEDIDDEEEMMAFYGR